MMDIFTESKLNKLREPFPDYAVDLKPIYIGEYEFDAGTCQSYVPASAWGKCDTCGKYHDLPAKHLRYVGHARITERLNDVDPEWNWEPMATDADGLPVVRAGCLWIRLTICGVTHIGVGDANGKTGSDAMKEMIGDAIRNAAMRFGCGLEMWFAWDDDTTSPKPPVTESKAAFRAIVRKNATKAQQTFADALNDLYESGGDVAAAIDAIHGLLGRSYYELNAHEVYTALSMLDEFRSDECEVIEV